MVFWLRLLLKVQDKFFPTLVYFLEDFCKHVNGYVLVHFLMQDAVVLVVLGWLPALFVLAVYLLADLLLVLSEIKTFGREHL